MIGKMHGVAVDAGSGLADAIAKARGPSARPDDHKRFKQIVLQVLGREATTVLLDAEYGPQLLQSYPAGCAPMIALEADVYRISDDDRITRLPENLRAEDFPALGVRLLKFFMYFAPDDPEDLNRRKLDIVAAVGQDCARAGIDFLFEPLVYARGMVAGSPDFAAIKPDLVRRTVATFADPRFNVAVLKIEVPVDLGFVEGFGAPSRSRAEALRCFAQVSQAAGDVPFVFLSAGVPFDWFEASLRMANEASCGHAGFMCGRAIWADAVGIFGQGGPEAMRDWLDDVGLSRLRRLKALVR